MRYETMLFEVAASVATITPGRLQVPGSCG